VTFTAAVDDLVFILAVFSLVATTAPASLNEHMKVIFNATGATIFLLLGAFAFLVTFTAAVDDLVFILAVFSLVATTAPASLNEHM